MWVFLCPVKTESTAAKLTLFLLGIKLIGYVALGIMLATSCLCFLNCWHESEEIWTYIKKYRVSRKITMLSWDDETFYCEYLLHSQRCFEHCYLRMVWKPTLLRAGVVSIPLSGPWDGKENALGVLGGVRIPFWTGMVLDEWFWCVHLK